MEGVDLLFLNLRGMTDEFNPTGKREFSVRLNESQAREMEKFGLNPKPLRKAEEEDEQMYHLKVHASWKVRPPLVKLITATNIKNPPILGEDAVGMIDDADITNVDIIFYPHQWTFNKGKPSESTGVKAYLHSLYVTIQEDPLMAKYAAMAEAAG